MCLNIFDFVFLFHSSEGRRQKSMAHPNPKFLKRVSERCQLVVAPQRDSWQWSVDPSKVLIVLMTWLGAKDKHILRYSDLYTKQGLDVLIVKSKAKDFIWPRNSMALAEHVCTVSQVSFYFVGFKHMPCVFSSLSNRSWGVVS